MKIVTVIGTRPQYIKIKPLFDYFKNNKVDNYLIDTNQHYSDNVSKNLIEELELKIDENLNIDVSNEIYFIADGIKAIYNSICNIKDKIDFIIIIGDTNTTLISAIVANKLGIKLAHIEAGIRCGDNNQPEEINRILVDNLANIHFISREKDSKNVINPIYIGDLEYNYLNSIEKEYGDISYDNTILMTIHRQDNLNVKNLNKIFKFCKEIKDKIIFPIHHRTKNFINKNNILIPDNIKIIDPLTYKEIILFMRECKGIISDSGGIIKTSPFFGKKCIIPAKSTEWTEVVKKGYATYNLDINWFNNYDIKRDTDFYYLKNSCDLIYKNLIEYK